MAAQIPESTKVTGVYKIHPRDCAYAARAAAYKEKHRKAKPAEAFEAAASEGKCRCTATFQAMVYSARDRKMVRKNFHTQTEAKNWRREIGSAVDAGKMRVGAKRTVAEAAAILLEGMKDGTIESRKGEPYEETTIGSYEGALEKYILPELARVKVAALDRGRIKKLVADLKRLGLAPSTIRNELDPLKVIIREAIDSGEITVDPMYRMKLPQGTGKRERVADKAEADTLLAALPDAERALWATGFYAGLRRAELRALRWSDIELAAGEGEIRVRRTWIVGKTERAGGKSDAAMRDVVIPDKLRKILAEHKLLSGRGGGELVFGRVEHQKGQPSTFSPSVPFMPSTVRSRALKAWGWKPIPNPALAEDPEATPKEIWVKAREDALEPIVLHESRHTDASYRIAAGLDDFDLKGQSGHSDVRTTKNIYGHHFPDAKQRIRAQVDAYHEAAG